MVCTRESWLNHGNRGEAILTLIYLPHKYYFRAQRQLKNINQETEKKNTEIAKTRTKEGINQPNNAFFWKVYFSVDGSYLVPRNILGFYGLLATVGTARP